MFPVVVMAIGDGMVPNGEPGAAAGVIIDDVVIVAAQALMYCSAPSMASYGHWSQGRRRQGGTAGGCGAGCSSRENRSRMT